MMELDLRASFYPIALSILLLVLLFTIATLQTLRQIPATERVPDNTALRAISRNIFESEGRFLDQVRAFSFIPIFPGLVFHLGFR